MEQHKKIFGAAYLNQQCQEARTGQSVQVQRVAPGLMALHARRRVQTASQRQRRRRRLSDIESTAEVDSD
jgi:hypothetical protein